MIRLPNLDDMKYAEIVDSAKRRIPVIFPEWTDFNEHDPGITIIELFAWLSEMQRYYLNKIPESVYWDMLRLLGIERKEARASEVLVTFPESEPIFLSPGTRISTSEEIEFVTTSEYKRPNFQIEKIYLKTDGETIDVTAAQGAFYPFGRRILGENRELYIGISQKCREAEICFDVDDYLPVKRNAPAEGSLPPREIVWEYSAASGFKPCDIIGDGTFALSFGGGIRFRLGEDFAARGEENLPSLFWIRARLIDRGCEDMPRIARIYRGALRLTQKNRLADYADIVYGGEEIEIKDMLASEGECFVFVRGEHGLQRDFDAVVTKTDFGAKICLSRGIAPTADGKPNVRIVFGEKNFSGNSMFFSSNGLPCQRMQFDAGGRVMRGELRLMVRGGKGWTEYELTDNLSSCGAYDKVFGYDSERREILFGDNERGEVPTAGESNIMILRCHVTKGEYGNVMAGNINRLYFQGGEYKLLQSCDSAGGSDREILLAAMERARELLNERSRCVSAEDYRKAAMSTPGVRIADAAAIPFFDAASHSVSENKAPNSVTVAVIPYSAEKFPVPDKRFLSAVREHLEGYRLITTDLRVAPPIYIRIEIYAEIECIVSDAKALKNAVMSEIEGLFSLYGKNGAVNFGKTINYDEIAGLINSVPGVSSVSRLKIRTDNPLCETDGRGGIITPPDSVAFCGDVEIEIRESLKTSFTAAFL